MIVPTLASTQGRLPMLEQDSESGLCVRQLRPDDIIPLVNAFTFPWTTREETLKTWREIFQEQEQGKRIVCVIEEEGVLMGYGSLLRDSQCAHLRAAKIPEISALWIDDKYRGQGLGSHLILSFEQTARKEGHAVIGIGVGLYGDYGRAQRLYCFLGYKPDGKGITYRGVPVVPGTQVTVDDDLILWMTKSLME